MSNRFVLFSVSLFVVLPETVHYTEAFRLYSCFPKDQDSDGYYDNYQDMLWYVYQQSVYWMEIRFIWIDIQNSNSCQLDFLEVND